MKIGVFCTSLHSPHRKPGGVDVLAHRAANELARRGEDVTVVSYSPPPADAVYAHERLSPPAFADRRLARILLVPWLWRRAHPERFDVVHLHGDDWFFAPRRTATVRTFHGSALHEARTATSWKRRISQYGIFGLELLSARLATACYASGAPLPRGYRLRGVLTCGVDVGGRPSPARAAGPPAILFVGTWEGRKRGRLLAAAFAEEVRAAVPDAELWMVSDRAEAGPGVRWFDNPDDAALRELFAAATVFCLPSSYEGLGVPYLEALATGLPVVTTDNPGARWVLADPSTGRIVPDGALGETLIRLLREPEEREALAAAGQRRARDFSWDVVCRAYLDAYRDARRRRAPSGP